MHIYYLYRTEFKSKSYFHSLLLPKLIASFFNYWLIIWINFLSCLFISSLVSTTVWYCSVGKRFFCPQSLKFTHRYDHFQIFSITRRHEHLEPQNFPVIIYVPFPSSPLLYPTELFYAFIGLVNIPTLQIKLHPLWIYPTACIIWTPSPFVSKIL